MKLNKLIFCPRCHRQVKLPFKGNVEIQDKLVITCSNCGKEITIKRQLMEKFKRDEQ